MCTFVSQLLLDGFAMFFVELFALFLRDAEVALVAVIVVELFRSVQKLALLTFVFFFQLLEFLLQLFLMHAQRLDLTFENVHSGGSNDGTSVGNHHVGKDLKGGGRGVRVRESECVREQV